MKILQVHVRHREPGGMEVLFDSMVTALRSRGHEVLTWQPDNRDISGLAERVEAALGGVFSPAARREMAALLARERPDLVHLHNVYPQLSPSVVGACNAAGVPVVMSLQDYKLICPTAQYFRDGAPCRRCSGGREYHCVLANCRGNLLESAAYSIRVAAARRAGWFTRGVDRFVACSEFVRRRYVDEGFPAERIEVIPNPGAMPSNLVGGPPGEYAAFIGRLSPEKGIETLLQAARISGIPVRIAGAGPSRPKSSDVPPNVRLLGAIGRDRVGAFLSGARFLVVPSLFEEPFGIVAAEGMGHGLPVIASRTGGLADIVEEGKTGYLVIPGDAEMLAERMSRLWSDPELAARLGAAARTRARSEYDGTIYYERLERIYQSLVSRCAQTAGARA